MDRVRPVIGVCMILPIIVVAIVSSGDDDEQKEQPRAPAAVTDLLNPDATLRDFRAAPEASQERFLERFTQLRLGEAEPTAMTELGRHLNSRFASLPAGGSPTDVLMAGSGRVRLWEAAEYAARNLGWPAR